jgi:transglutaminase-like putative cysteine protease
MARREMPFCSFFLRLMEPSGKCLPHSLALCAYLRRLGLPASVVIGRARFTEPYDFHA